MYECLCVSLKERMVSGLAGQFIFVTLAIRIGPRILMLIGTVFSGTFFIMLGRVNTLCSFYLLYVLLYLGSMAYGGSVANTIVNNRFVFKKGKALGIATAGMSFSGAVLPFAAMILVIKSSVSDAFLWIGLFTMMVGPLSWLVVRNWPEDIGMAPDGALQQGARTFPNPSDPDINPIKNNGKKEFWTLRRLVHTAAFWKLGFSFALLLDEAATRRKNISKQCITPIAA
jgi:MFS transporter, OFA family, oxalate/formate antiporter